MDGGDVFGGEGGESGQAGGDPLVEKGIGLLPGATAATEVPGDQAPALAIPAGRSLSMGLFLTEAGGGTGWLCGRWEGS